MNRIVLSPDVQPTGMVFGIPLSKCIANDQEIQRRRSADPLRERKESDVIINRQGPRYELGCKIPVFSQTSLEHN